jgi:hypothetical protein
MYKLVKPQEVAEGYVQDKNKMPGKDYLIIDVRGDDFPVIYYSTYYPWFIFVTVFKGKSKLVWQHSWSREYSKS